MCVCDLDYKHRHPDYLAIVIALFAACVCVCDLDCKYRHPDI